MRLRTLAFLLVLCGLASLASAQTPVLVTKDSGVSFAASADHNAVSPGTTIAILDHYDLTVVAINPVGAIGFTFGLGKPTPDATNTITVKPIASFGSLGAGTFSAFVAAVGPGGTSAGTSSDSFVRAGAPSAPGKTVIVPK